MQTHERVLTTTHSKVALVLVLPALACSRNDAVRPSSDAAATSASRTESSPPITPERSKMLKLSSPAFDNQSRIAKRFTCQGGDISPPLSWFGAPEETQSFALIVEDPDAPDPARPKTVWVHWVLYNLPATAKTLGEGIKDLPAGTREGKNDWNLTGYRGPCPPIGRHRYFHKVYALDATLPDLGTPTKAELERAMQGHVLAQAELMGTYQKD